MKDNAKETLAAKAAARDKGKEALGKRSGDHVFLYQERAEAEGFKNVSRPWFNQTLEFDGVKETVASDAVECSDMLVSADALKLAEDSTFKFDGESLSLSPRARRQLANWSKLPAGICDTLLADEEDAEAKELFARLFNRGMRLQHGEREQGFKVRLRGTEVRAVFSERYAPIDNGWFLEVLSSIVEGGRVSHLRYDGDSVSGLVLIPDTIRTEQDSDYGGGIHFRNSEVGTSSLFVCPSVFRSICMNGCIWGELEGESLVRRVHAGEVKLPVLAARIRTLVNDQIPLTTYAIDKMLATKDVRITEGTIAAVRIMAVTGNVNNETRREWLKGFMTEGGDVTAFGIVQGLTRGAQALKPEAAVEAEELAGWLTNRKADFWNWQAERNSDVEDKVLIRTFGEGLLQEAGVI